MKNNQQTIIACDKQGKFIKYIPKEVGHTGCGQRHLAITVLLYNSKGEVLLQKRKHKIFDDIWDFTGATHPLHLESGKDESFEEATVRCLKREYGLEIREVRVVGVFNYFSKYESPQKNSGSSLSSVKKDQNGLCENEFCAMLVGEYNGKLKLNPEVGYGYKWIGKDEFLKDIKINPKNYSPWAVVGIKVLEAAGFLRYSGFTNSSSI